MEPDFECYYKKIEGDEFKHIYEFLEFTKHRWVELFEDRKYNKHLGEKTVVGMIGEELTATQPGDEETINIKIRYIMINADFAFAVIPKRKWSERRYITEKQLDIFESLGWIVDRKSTYFAKEPSVWFKLKTKADRINAATLIHSTLLWVFEHELGEELVLIANDIVLKEKRKIKTITDARNFLGRFLINAGFLIGDFRDEKYL